jgi:hypothetical protein
MAALPALQLRVMPGATQNLPRSGRRRTEWTSHVTFGPAKQRALSVVAVTAFSKPASGASPPGRGPAPSARLQATVQERVLRYPGGRERRIRYPVPEPVHEEVEEECEDVWENWSACAWGPWGCGLPATDAGAEGSTGNEPSPSSSRSSNTEASSKVRVRDASPQSVVSTLLSSTSAVVLFRLGLPATLCRRVAEQTEYSVLSTPNGAQIEGETRRYTSPALCYLCCLRRGHRIQQRLHTRKQRRRSVTWRETSVFLMIFGS